MMPMVHQRIRSSPGSQTRPSGFNRAPHVSRTHQNLLYTRICFGTFGVSSQFHRQHLPSCRISHVAHAKTKKKSAKEKTEDPLIPPQPDALQVAQVLCGELHMWKQLVPLSLQEGTIQAIFETFSYKSSVLCDLLRLSRNSKHEKFISVVILNLLEVIDECTSGLHRRLHENDSFWPEDALLHAKTTVRARFADILAYIEYHGLKFQCSSSRTDFSSALDALELEFLALQYRPRRGIKTRSYTGRLDSSALQRSITVGQKISFSGGDSTLPMIPQLSPDGAMLAWGKGDATSVIDPVSSQVMHEFQHDTSRSSSISGNQPIEITKFNPAGGSLVVYAEHRNEKLTLFEFHPVSWCSLPVFIGNDSVRDIEWSPDGSALACLHGNSIVVWQVTGVATERIYRSEDTDSDFLAWVVSNKQLVLLCISSEGSVQAHCPAADSKAPVWGDSEESDVQVLRKLSPKKSYSLDATVTRVASAPAAKGKSNTVCVAVCDDGKLQVLQGGAKPQKNGGTLPFHSLSRLGLGSVTAFVFSHSGRQLAAGGTDGVVHVWITTQSGGLRPKNALKDHGTEPKAVTCIAWKPDGSMLAVGAANGTVKVWSIFLQECEHEWKVSESRRPVRSLQFFGRDLYILRKGEPLVVYRTKQNAIYDKTGAVWSARFR